MPKRKIDGPAVQAWIADLSPSQRLQYVPFVRRFLDRRTSSDPGSASTDELVDFVLGLSGATTVPKAVSALKHFFGHATQAGSIATDPARFLPKAVQRRESENALRAELTKAGLPDGAAEQFSWRDAVPLTLGHASKTPRLKLSDDVRAGLTDALLARLRTVTGASDVDAVLDSPVLERVGR